MESRVIQLEELLSHQQHLVQQLNEAVVELRADLERLERRSKDQLARLEERLGGGVEIRDLEDEKPPHY